MVSEYNLLTSDSKKLLNRLLGLMKLNSTNNIEDLLLRIFHSTNDIYHTESNSLHLKRCAAIISQLNEFGFISKQSNDQYIFTTEGKKLKEAGSFDKYYNLKLKCDERQKKSSILKHKKDWFDVYVGRWTTLICCICVIITLALNNKLSCGNSITKKTDTKHQDTSQSNGNNLKP